MTTSVHTMLRTETILIVRKKFLTVNYSILQFIIMNYISKILEIAGRSEIGL